MNYSPAGNWISYYCKDVVALFHCQIDLKYSHQLIVIHGRKFSGYLYDNEKAEKMGRKLNLQVIKD